MCTENTRGLKFLQLMKHETKKLLSISDHFSAYAPKEVTNIYCFSLYKKFGVVLFKNGFRDE